MPESGSLTIGAIAPSRAIDPPRPRVTEGQSPDFTLHERLDTLFEKIFAGRATGEQWLDLCHLITPKAPLYLRQTTWSEVADRLAEDMGRSRGPDFLAHYEAMRMLVAHPASRRHAVRAISALPINPTNPFVIDPSALLQDVVDN